MATSSLGVICPLICYKRLDGISSVRRIVAEHVELNLARKDFIWTADFGFCGVLDVNAWHVKQESAPDGGACKRTALELQRSCEFSAVDHSAICRRCIKTNRAF